MSAGAVPPGGFGEAIAGAAITAAAVMPIKLSCIPVLLLPIEPGRVAGGSDGFRPRVPPFSDSLLQRFFECMTAMSADRPVPWQTRQVSPLALVAVLRAW